VNADGTFLSQFGFASLAHPASGEYVFLLSAPPLVPTNTVPSATVALANGQISYTLTSGGFDILTFDAIGGFQDRPFSVVVYDLT
jgi:hypothetical protein